ncbi:hypothetical protein [Streptomyces cellulosae]|uniref:hypothetical protein n=1 Tax=Streptomyces cellulosae TaxID=1968 RepID=UPI0004C8ED34|nr:hypothetical protein [Streptomyces cellulosae]
MFTGVSGSGKSSVVFDTIAVESQRQLPDGGRDGGRVVFEGTPRQLLDAAGPFTGEHLRRAVAEAGVLCGR